MEQFDAIIIGAGPAGMMATIRAAERNRRVLLIERNDTLGRKLLISGKGRCNLTNLPDSQAGSCDIKEFLDKFSESRDFLRNAFARFFNADLISFFKDAGLALKTERGGRVFPVSDKANDVLNVLKSKLQNMNIKLLSGERVKEIIITDSDSIVGPYGTDYKEIKGVLTYSGKRFSAPHIAIATGGLSYPETGSTGDGYILAEKLSHKIVPLKPALSPIIIKDDFIKDWQGIALKNVRLALVVNGKVTDERFGEMLFTHFGLSGPIVLDISADVYDALIPENSARLSHSGGKVELSINFKPALTYKILDARLLREFKENSGKSIKTILRHLLVQGIISRFLEYCGVDGDKNVSQITSEERKKLIEGLFDLRLTVEGIMPIKDGIVTRGGVNTKEINPKTMESRLVKGLFFAGEIIDIDAKTGGYNMQAAFSTGWVCGDNI